MMSPLLHIPPSENSSGALRGIAVVVGFSVFMFFVVLKDVNEERYTEILDFLMFWN